MNNDLLSLVRRFGNDFHSWLRHSLKSLPNRLTRDKKSLFTVTHALFFIYLQATESHSKHFADNFVGPGNRNCGDDTGAILLAVEVMPV